MGASAGGLEAFSRLRKALPEHTGMALVLVQHLDPTHESQLGDLLGRTTRMPVLEAADGLALQPDRVYVITPNTTLTLAAAGVLHVEPRSSERGPHLPIDHFFRSLAEQQQSSATGVVLSGTGSDATRGLEEIKAAGGITFAQDEASAAHAGMPQSAVHSGCIDRVLSPDQIAHELARIGQHAYVSPTRSAHYDTTDDEAHFKAVLALLRSASGVDFSAYRDTTLKRRIARRMALHGGDPSRYVEHLRGHRAELDALYQDILINVTSFFREPAVFETLKSRAFPEILTGLQPDSTIRIWVPGCSSGQEAYSLAIALLEFLDGQPLRPPVCIFATDLSDTVSLQKAREGLYPDSIEAEVSPERLRRFFTKEDSKYRVTKELREIVVFARQNVAADPPFSRIDLVSCRNLLIYLSPALQKRVIPSFHYALKPGGFLLLGASENISGYSDLFSVVDQPHRLYGRKSVPGGRSYPHFRVADYQARQAGDADAAPPRPQPADWQREADRVAAGQYVPPGVLVNDDFDILQFRGQTGSFLAPPVGDPSHNLLKMAREGLFMPLRAAVLECKQTDSAVRSAGVRVRGESVDRVIDLHVIPVRLPRTGERCYLVLFEEQSHHASPVARPPEAPQEAHAAEMHHLRQELASTREYLQSMIEQQDAANEELKSANEEILSSNEELQSTNEELETAKEELQSVNEELTTVNEQLQHRNTQLARLNDDLTNLLASSGVAKVVLGVDLRIRRFTPAAGKLLGLMAGDVGRPIVHLKLGVELPDIETLTADVLASVQVRECEVRALDGRCYQLRVHPYRTADNRIDGAVLVLFDIDALRRAQTAAQEAREYAEAIVETVREALLVLDAQLRVQSANHAFYAMFGVAPGETVGRPLHELGNGQWDIPALREQLDEVLKQDAPIRDLDIRHDFDSIGTKVMRLNARRIAREGGRAELILLAIEDHTELTRLEDKANQQFEELVENDRRRKEFLALLAHELRNPLAPIRNGLQILDRIDSPAEAPRGVRATIARQVQQLTRLIDDLLDVARIDRGRIEVRKERIELIALVRAAVEEARLACEGKQVNLAAAVPEQAMWLDGDAARLTQALGNVLNNAFKFSDAGGRIDVMVERRGTQALINVRDTGVGISADQLPRVFEMFMQADATLERSRSGLGIGLALVKQLIEAHGGTVTMRSAGLGHGCEIDLQLPLASGPAADVPATAVERENVLSAVELSPLVRRRILVVDDNRDAADMLASILTMEGHDVRTAYDGRDALALAAAWQPEVALLDIGLPGMSGYEVARRIRDQPDGERILLAALTGLGQAEERRHTTEAGFDAHLVKPVASSQIEALIAGMASTKK